MVALSALPQPGFSEDTKPQLPSSYTIGGGTFTGGERTFAMGPHDAVLVQEKVEGKYRIAAEVGGGV